MSHPCNCSFSLSFIFLYSNCSFKLLTSFAFNSTAGSRCHPFNRTDLRTSAENWAECLVMKSCSCWSRSHSDTLMSQERIPAGTERHVTMINMSKVPELNMCNNVHITHSFHIMSFSSVPLFHILYIICFFSLYYIIKINNA